MSHIEFRSELEALVARYSSAQEALSPDSSWLLAQTEALLQKPQSAASALDEVDHDAPHEGHGAPHEGHDAPHEGHGAPIEAIIADDAGLVAFFDAQAQAASER